MYESSSAKLGVIKLSKEIEEKKEEYHNTSQQTAELQQKMSVSSSLSFSFQILTLRRTLSQSLSQCGTVDE
jgi:hypothetical protein